ncbi:oligogalacturonate-specific porin KdgM family protein [Endozoicomonas elysicola]|uniref:Porin n=1 Tax=Endozoicomonas elysicola TaxID=305900 RepID=A0A081KF97_9GAMM|nr:oligogalacturonate-specific porin KdgM family protein [Endozoicomonas elysicola]KEI72823.1 porin [Endozoicomonas elysicola]
MKRVLLGTVLATSSAMAFAGGSYVTGNVQSHSKDIHGSSMTSTLEAGHTFDTTERGGLTVLTEFDGIQIGNAAVEGVSSSPYITLGVEQAYSLTDNLWVAAGYHHLLHDGDFIQARPLVKIGYNFDNGVAISNRTRWHLDQTGAAGDADNIRTDNAISYQMQNQPVQLKYNNVYMWKDNSATVADEKTMDHEFRATWTKAGVQPYVEWRNQADDANNALVLGASLGF